MSTLSNSGLSVRVPGCQKLQKYWRKIYKGKIRQCERQKNACAYTI